MSLSKDVAKLSSVSSSARRTMQGQWYDFYDFTELQNSFWQLIAELDLRSCCARHTVRWKPKASGQAGYPGITLQEELEDDGSIWIFPDEKWLLVPTFVPVVGFLASAGGAPMTMGVVPLVLCGFPTITFEQMLVGSVSCGLLYVAVKWISQRGEDDRAADDFWCMSAVGPVLISALANLVVAAHPFLGFETMDAKTLLPMHAFLSLPGAPLQIFALGSLAADEKWNVAPIAFGDLWSSLFIACALQPSLGIHAASTLLLKGGILTAAVGYQLVYGFPARAQMVSGLNQIRVQAVGDFLVTCRVATLFACGLGMLPQNPPQCLFGAFVIIDFVAKVGAGHLMLKDKEAMTNAMRVFRSRRERGTAEAIYNQRPGAQDAGIRRPAR